MADNVQNIKNQNHFFFFVCPPEGGLGSSRIKQTCSPMGLVLVAMSVRVVVAPILLGVANRGGGSPG